MMEKWINSFKKSTVLVVGDVMIDCYLRGKVTRISPEAPVPVVDLKEREYRLGGAANVALNLKSLGATPILCSVVGDDRYATLFKELMRKWDFDDQNILFSSERKTTVKYRVIGNHIQMLRVDEEDDSQLNKKDSLALMTVVNEIVQNYHIDAVIFVDYDKGILFPQNIEQIVALAKTHHILTTVDPKKRNFHFYKGVDLFKPNLKEFIEGLSLSFNQSNLFNLKEMPGLMRMFAEKTDIRFLMTTLSERGIALYDKESVRFHSHPARPRSISDVSGAGDSVITVATLGLVAGLNPEEIMVLSNMAGGAVCEYAGVVPVTIEMLQREIAKSKP